MGGKPSSLPPPSLPNNTFFSITLRIYDTIKVVDADVATITLIRQIITTYWTDGIQKESVNECGTVDFKLNGSPFMRAGNRCNAIQIKRVCCMLFTGLKSIGWRLIVSSDLSRLTDLSTLFFERNVADQSILSPQIVCLSLSAFDKLQLINAPQTLHNQLIECVGTMVQNCEQIGSDIELKLCGYPWNSSNREEGIQARRLLLNIFRQFHSNQGFVYYGIANLKSTADCIFFEKIGNASVVNYCCVSLNINDRIRLINCPKTVIEVVGCCIVARWPRGIQETRSIDANTFEYKLGGYPWNCHGDDAINSRRLIAFIIEECVRVGWSIVTALDISRRVTDKSIFILRNCQPASIPHICLAPNESDRIWLINNTNRDLVRLVSETLNRHWTYGIQHEVDRGGCYEWKLVSNPWSSTGRGDVFGGDVCFSISRILMTRMMGELARNGWRVICSADVSSKYIQNTNNNSDAHPIDVHSWFIAYVGRTSALNVVGFANTLSLVDCPPPTYDEAVNTKP